MSDNSYFWFYPVTGFLLSGWFVAAYFAFMPGYIKMMSEAPEGTILNATSPALYLGVALIINVASWGAAILQPIHDEVPTE